MVEKRLTHCYVTMERDFGEGPETAWNHECRAESEADALQQAEAASRLSFNDDCVPGFVWAWAGDNVRNHILFGPEVFN